MAKIPFDIKYRPQIESGEYKVENRDGKPVRIICWDKKSEKKYGYHIVGLIEYGPEHEESTYYTIDGKGRLKDKDPDLYIITPEPELTEFEKKVKDLCWKIGMGEVVYQDNIIKEKAAELLELAMKELAPTFGAEYMNGYEDGVNYGKAEALKGLPRWEKDNSIKAEQHITVGKNGERFHYKGHSLLIPSLVKLPGFKEN